MRLCIADGRAFEPGFFPEDQAFGLTPSMSLTSAANVFQMDSLNQAATARPVDGITGFVGAFEHAQSLAAMLEHFRHEWQAIQTTVSVERAKNFLLAPHLNKVASL